MKTYKEVVEKPRLIIEYEDDAMSPREDTNLGYFITKDSNYYSPDQYETLEAIVKLTGDEAESLEDHIKKIKRDVEKELDEKVLAIYPVVKYEHGGVSYSLGSQHGFDYSNNGFYIITAKTLEECFGTQRRNKKDWEKAIREELSLYNQYCNGEILRFTLFDKDGEWEDGVGGFYDIEDIRQYLPKEWAKVDLDEYLKN